MNYFYYKGDVLYAEDVPVTQIAREVGTPFYLYSYKTLTHHFHVFDAAFQAIPHIVCFAVKANSNIAILRAFTREGGGVDLVSGGELFRALKAGADPQKIVYSGVGKRVDEIDFALKTGILMFNVESDQELETINERAGLLGIQAGIALRVNPNVDPQTHPHISTGLKENKFGIDLEHALSAYQRAVMMPHLDIKGVSCHIGSQVTTMTPFIEALTCLRELIKRLQGMAIPVRYLDLGGGLGITYNEETPPAPAEYAKAIIEAAGDLGCTFILEPGRVIVGNAGAMVTKVLYTKRNDAKHFIIVDAGMNDLLRPALYGSYHEIRPVILSNREEITADVVGPICESGDFIAKNRRLPAFARGDLLVAMSAGAYGFSMSSNYNSRPRPPEVLVRDNRHYVIKTRESYEDLVRGEVIPAFMQD